MTATTITLNAIEKAGEGASALRQFQG